MNDITDINTDTVNITLDNDQVDALMAKIYAADNMDPADVPAGDPSDGEDTQPEGAFIAEDTTSKQLN